MSRRFYFGLCPIVLVGLILFAKSSATRAADGDEIKAPIEAPPDDRSGLRKLAKDSAVWADIKNKQIVMDGEVCLTKGQLEMFACPKETKEHESVVAIDGKAYVVHAGLLAIGAKIGGPVKFEPTYQPASGTQIDVYCFWTDSEGKKRSAPAQHWVRNLKTKKPMEYQWVFAGSGFWTEELVDENSGKAVSRKHYLGDTGDFICVSNFTSATLDLPVKSPKDNENLLFEAFTENIPPRGTKVTVVLAPKLEKLADSKGASPTAKSATK